MFPGQFAPGNESSREREGQGAKVPGSELARVLLADSLRGANWPGSEKAVNHVSLQFVLDDFDSVFVGFIIYLQRRDNNSTLS